MIIILKSGASDAQIDHVIERVEALGLKAHLSRGTYRTIIGVIGDELKLQAEPLRAIPGVSEVIPVLPPYKLASREAHPQPSIVDVAGVKIGGGNLGMNSAMWEKPAVQRNIHQLRADGVKFIDPTSGWLSCRQTGKGRMAEPDAILTAIRDLLESDGKHHNK